MCSKFVKKVLALTLLIVFSIGIQTQLNAQISYITVEKTGSGVKEQDAVMDAIEQALMQVNGAAVATSSMTTISETVNNNGKDEKYASAEAFLQNISAATKGIIKGYEILQSDKGAGELALYEVKISVTVPKYETSKQLERLRVAVPSIYLKQNINTKKLQTSAYEIKTKIIDHLTQTRKFAVIDRDFLGETNKELKLIQGVNFKIEEMARLGNQVGVDFILLPTVFKHKIATSVKTSKFSGKKFINHHGISEVSIKLIDVATSQIKLSKTLKATTSSSSYSKLADLMALRISETITNSIMPPQVISLSGKELTINQGGDAMAKGRRFNIFRLGKRLFDPDTNESLGREETLSGVVEIVRSTDKMSTAKLIKKITIKKYSELTNDLFVLRADSKQRKGLGDFKRRSLDAVDKKINKRMEKMKEKSKKDW
jgi:curli biogenesis system outer membrane secretion channel CsgG